MTKARDALAAATAVSPSQLDLTDDEIDTVLDLARIAAHDSGARTNAPLLCYLVGRAQAGHKLDELAEAVRRSTS
jgi:hypothetical protein